MKPIFTTEAIDDLVAAARFYDERAEGLGDRFQAAIFAAVRRVCEAPESWPLIDTEARFFQVDDFPYALVYFVEEKKEVVVVAVFQLQQDPEKLRQRLKP